jgi:hypothetical protein
MRRRTRSGRRATLAGIGGLLLALAAAVVIARGSGGHDGPASPATLDRIAAKNEDAAAEAAARLKAESAAAARAADARRASADAAGQGSAAGR